MDVAAITRALDTARPGALDALLEPCDLSALPVDVLNRLLVNDHHRQHQRVAFALQHASDPTSLPFVAESLDRGFARLAYTASDDAVIAKWFSWLLAAIGTPEAVDLMRRWADSDNAEVAEEMAYRLGRLGGLADER